MLSSEDDTPTSHSRIAIPVSAGTNALDPTVEMEPVRPRLVRRRILLVEPNDHIRFARAHSLRGAHSVATAPAIGGALRLLASEAFDVIIVTDAPGTDAYALLHAVAQMWPGTRRALIAGRPTVDLERVLTERCVDRVYAQPFDEGAFLRDLARGAAVADRRGAESSRRSGPRS